MSIFDRNHNGATSLEDFIKSYLAFSFNPYLTRIDFYIYRTENSFKLSIQNSTTLISIKNIKYVIAHFEHCQSERIIPRTHFGNKLICFTVDSNLVDVINHLNPVTEVARLTVKFDKTKLPFRIPNHVVFMTMVNKVELLEPSDIKNINVKKLKDIGWSDEEALLIENNGYTII